MFKKAWGWLVASFEDSETIVWARVKIVAGTVFYAVQQSGADLSVFLNSKWLAAWQILSTFLLMDGIFSEYARRRRGAFKGEDQ